MIPTSDPAASRATPALRPRALPLSRACALLLAAATLARPARAEAQTPAGARGAAAPGPATVHPTEQPYRGGPVPAGAQVEVRRSPWPGILGGALFGAAYLPGAVLGSVGLFAPECRCVHYTPMLLPVVGPLISGVWSVADRRPDGALVLTFGVAAALAQASGLALIAAGAQSHEVLVFPRAPTTRRDRDRAPRFVLAPGADGAAAGPTLTATHF